MKKTWSLIGLLSILALVAISLVAAIPTLRRTKEAEVKKPESKLAPADEYLAGLKDAGFINVLPVAEASAVALRKHYKEKYGFNFMAEHELQAIIEENGLIVGPAERFIGNIPPEAAKEIGINYNKFKNSDLFKSEYWTAPDNKIWTKEQIESMNTEDRGYVLSGVKSNAVLVAAPEKQFNTEGMVIRRNFLVSEPRDPIAFIRVEGGYIELGRWL